MQRMRISASRLHLLVAVISLAISCVWAGAGLALLVGPGRAQPRSPGERIATLEANSAELVNADERIATEVKALRGEVQGLSQRINAVESEVGAWKFAVTAVGAVLGILQAILLLTKGRIAYVPAEDDRPRRGSGSH